MTSETSQTYRAAAAIFRRGDSHRVWSLIVTIFGDLAQRDGNQLSGATLSRLTDLMGVKPQAMRVALHRLRKDGWIESVRDGRASLHFLTAFGRAQSAAASDRIYNLSRAFPDLWHVLITHGTDGVGRADLDAGLLVGDYVSISPQVLMAPGPLPQDVQELKGVMGVETSTWTVPDWVKVQICPDDLLAQYAGLQKDLDAVCTLVQDQTDLSLFEAAALRCLAVHSWRCLLLRHPDLPTGFFPDGWTGARCRALFSNLMTLIPAPPLMALEGGVIASSDSPRDIASA